MLGHRFRPAPRRPFRQSVSEIVEASRTNGQLNQPGHLHRSHRQTNSLGGLPLEGLVALSESNPVLLAPRPYMPGRSQPGCIVEGPGPDPYYAAARQAIYPTRAIWAHKPGIEPSAVGHALDRSRLACNATEGRFGQGNPQGEGTARDPLAISAMARIDQ